jgi:HlyD family secretion protein
MSIKRKKVIAIIVFIVIIIVASFFYQKINAEKNALLNKSSTQQEYVVNFGSIKKTITGSGSIQPADLRTVSSDREGTISKVYVEEGQLVIADEILSMFQLESDDASEKLEIETAEYNLSKAQRSLNELYKTLDSLKIYAEESGTLKIYIEEGEEVSTNTKIADITEINKIKVRSYFTKSQIEDISIGDKVDAFFPDYIITLEGVITSLDKTPIALGSGSIGYMVEAEISYNGALTEGTKAKITVTNNKGIYVSPFTGESLNNNTESVYSKYAAVVETIYVDSGQYVNKGDLIAVLSSEELAYDISQQEIQVQQKKLDLIKLNEDDDAITSPISGTVLTVLVNEQGYVEKGTQLFKIADLDKMEVKIDIDELDIMNISKGQEVTITSDVFENEFFSGKVKSISLSGSNSSGVTTYEVTVSLDDRKNLMSGMNVDVEIMISQNENTLVIPIEAVSKIGGKYVVMVKDEEGNIIASEIEVGIITDSNIEVIGGLSQGNSIYYTVTEGATTANINGGIMMPMTQTAPKNPNGGGRNQ